MRRAFLVFPLAALVACGGQTTTPSDAGPDVASDSPADAPPLSGGETFAVKRVYLGEADRSGVPAPAAWKNYGRDIDGLQTTSTSTDVCTLGPGAPKSVQTDGNAGIDNSWGASVLPIFETISSAPTPSVTATSAIGVGLTTLLIQISGLSDDPAQTASGLTGTVVAGATDIAPAFDSSTSWPTLSGETPASFSASVAGGVVTTSPSATPLVFELPLSPTITLKLTIHEPVVTFTHSDPADLTNGTISGVLDPNELIAAFGAIAGELSTSLCGTAQQGVDDQLRQDSEILLDGTNQAGTPCTGISIGLGFDAVRIAPSTSSGPLASPPNPCP
jgi:hypothetical protein